MLPPPPSALHRISIMPTSPQVNPRVPAIPLSATARLRRALRQRISEDRRLAWQVLPFFLGLFLAVLVLGLITESQLGQAGDASDYVGQAIQWSIPAQLLEPASPPSEAKDILDELSPEIVEPEPEQLVEIDSAPIDIRPPDSPTWQQVKLDITSDSPPLVNIDELAQPEAAKAEPSQPQAKPKAKPSSKIASTKLPAISERKSSLGSSDSKAAGKVSVSYKYAPQPPYPTRMRASKTQGTVIVRIQVNAAGRPQSVSIKKSSGHAEFDDIARSWILNKWSFNPAQEGGKAVASVVTTSIKFVYS